MEESDGGKRQKTAAARGDGVSSFRPRRPKKQTARTSS